MKNLLILITIMLVGGCNKTPTLEESVVGEYEFKPEDGDTENLEHVIVLLENGISRLSVVSGYRGNGQWSIVDGKIHIRWDYLRLAVYRINKDSSITEIESTQHGFFRGAKRLELPKEEQSTLKKIK